MLTYEQVLTLSRADLNDQAGNVFTNLVLLPYLNMTLLELQQTYELNDKPVMETTSATIKVPAGYTRIGFDTVPSLPRNLVEIQGLYESDLGQDNWVPITKRNFLTSLVISVSQARAYFGWWAWQEQSIKLLSVTSDRDIKMDYTRSLFQEPLELNDLGLDQIIINADSFIHYRTAALAAEFITENKERAVTLNGYAMLAMRTDLGISAKGRQAIMTRRQPFRAGYKRLRGYYRG